MHSSLASSRGNPGCTLMTLSTGERFSSERQVRATALFQLSLVSIWLYLSYLSCLSYEKNS